MKDVTTIPKCLPSVARLSCMHSFFKCLFGQQRQMTMTVFWVILCTFLPLLSQAQFVKVGQASNVTGTTCYQLTPDAELQTGAIWFQSKINLSFDAHFEGTLNFGTKDANGADGIGFVLQPLSNGIGALGSGLGFGGISPSLGVEFDVFQNPGFNDPQEDHIALVKNGVLDHQSAQNLQGPAILPNLEDGANHPFVINWNATTKTLTVSLDGVVRLNYTSDIVNTVFGGTNKVFWGFTASTGAFYNTQTVCLGNYTFTKDPALTWVGDSGGGSAPWSVGVNWAGGAAPTSSDDVIFDAAGGDAYLDRDVEMKSLDIKADFLRTVDLRNRTLKVRDSLKAREARMMDAKSGNIEAVAARKMALAFLAKVKNMSIKTERSGIVILTKNLIVLNILSITAGSVLTSPNGSKVLLEGNLSVPPQDMQPPPDAPPAPEPPAPDAPIQMTGPAPQDIASAGEPMVEVNKTGGEVAIKTPSTLYKLDVLKGTVNLMKQPLTIKQPSTVQMAGQLKGNGLIKVPTLTIQQSGTIAPGNSPGLMTIEGDLILANGAILEYELTATERDTLVVQGNVTITGAILNINATGTQTGVLTVINNDGTDPIIGTFAGLPEGSPVTILGAPYTISYSGGTGNDITLTFVCSTGVHIPDANFAYAIRQECPTCIDACDNLTADAATLTHLDVFNESISDLTGISDFTALRHLNCGFNRLQSLPNLPSSLQSLNCEINQLTSLPTLPSGLVSLSCSDNPLTGLPTLPSSLQVLGVYATSISCLPTLPNGLTYLGLYPSTTSCIPNNVPGLVIHQSPYSTITLPTCSPSIVTHPSVPSLLCSLSSVTLTAKAAGTGAMTVKWQRKAVGASGFTDIGTATVYTSNTDATYTTPLLSISDNGAMYQAVFTASCASATTTNAATLVLDNIAPQITCPIPLSKNTDLGVCGAVVTYPTPTATDNCSVTVTKTSGLASGATFPVGTSSVVFKATDASNNTATCSFTVTVNISADPTLIHAYTAIAFEDLKMKTNTVQSGGIGVVNMGKKAKLEQSTMVTAANTFVKAADLNLNSGSVVTTYFTGGVSAGILPTFLSNNNPTNNNIDIPENATQTLSLSSYGKIEVSKNATAIFTGNAQILVREIKLKEGASLVFSQNTRVLVNKKMETDESAKINLAGLQNVQFFVEEDVKIDENNIVKANIYTQKNLKVEKSNNSTTAMTGLFIADKIDAKENVIWNRNPNGCANNGGGGLNLASTTVLVFDLNAEPTRSRLNWVSNLGATTDYFTVQKQDNATGEFVKLQTINNTIAGNEPHYFTAYDSQPTEGDNIYRIELTLNDGTTQFTEVKMLTFKGLETVRLYPNPALEEAWLDLKPYEGRSVNITISDLAGKNLFQDKIEKASAAPYRLDLENLQMGLYFVKIQAQGDKITTHKLQVVR